jgi:hypothetical protein
MIENEYKIKRKKKTKYQSVAAAALSLLRL